VIAGRTDLARPWVLAAGGRFTSAAREAVDVGRRAGERGLLGLEVLACHDAVRLGGAPQVADRLEELVALCQGALVRVAARQARAVTERDGAQLAAISRVFEQAGMLLHAAEAAAQAAASTPDTATGRAQAARAVALARRCDGARTPALATLAAPALTRRELQIARLAGSGRTSREIAARLVVSVRTVDNHLASVFAELGVSRRTDLAPLPDP
jgi:DNA-binding CsgD family transcriptional regulator